MSSTDADNAGRLRLFASDSSPEPTTTAADLQTALTELRRRFGPSDARWLTATIATVEAELRRQRAAAFTPNRFYPMPAGRWRIGALSVRGERMQQALLVAWMMLGLGQLEALRAVPIVGGERRATAVRNALRRAARFVERYDATVGSVLFRIRVTASCIVVPDVAELQLLAE